MNRRTFLKWFGASTVVAATTDPMKLLEGLEEEVIVEESTYSELYAGFPVSAEEENGVIGIAMAPCSAGDMLVLATNGRVKPYGA